MGIKKHSNAFTLVELLVVVAVLGLLMSILLPSLKSARQQARKIVCLSNARQLAIANQNYSLENCDHYVPAAMDRNIGFGGRHRWHGVRETSLPDSDPAKNTFDPLKGPLIASLGDGRIKRCPSFRKYRDYGITAFEAGCGGYGYNDRGVGSRSYLYATPYSPTDLMEEYTAGMPSSYIHKPAETVMFSDAAIARGAGNSYLIEYSFCEAPLWVGNLDGDSRPEEISGFFADPTIHFRHASRSANVAWVDGHGSTEKFKWTIDSPNIYGANSDRMNLGWFGGRDNELFDPF